MSTGELGTLFAKQAVFPNAGQTISNSFASMGIAIKQCRKQESTRPHVRVQIVVGRHRSIGLD